MKPEQLSKELVKTNGQKGLTALIRDSVKELKTALPAHLSPERMVRIALTSIRLNPKLAECTPDSFLGSLFILAQVGLEPIAGRAYLLPFNNNRKIGNEWKTVKEVQALIGYKGLVDLFYRHQLAMSMDMQTVYAADEFDYQYGTHAYLNHKPSINKGTPIGYYAIAKLQHGGVVFKYMTDDECMEHGRKHSKTYDKKTGTFSDYSPWSKDKESMCKKTVLIQLSKVIPLSVELQKAISVDETSRDYRKGISDMADLPDNASWKEKEVEEADISEEEKKESPKKETPKKATKEQEDLPEEPIEEKQVEVTGINVSEALKRKEGEVITIKGIFNAVEEKPSKKEISFYIYLMLDGKNNEECMLINSWDKVEYKKGEIMIAENVKIIKKENGLKYVASKLLKV